MNEENWIGKKKKKEEEFKEADEEICRVGKKIPWALFHKS